MGYRQIHPIRMFTRNINMFEEIFMQCPSAQIECRLHLMRRTSFETCEVALLVGVESVAIALDDEIDGDRDLLLGLQKADRALERKNDFEIANAQLLINNMCIAHVNFDEGISYHINNPSNSVQGFCQELAAIM